MASDLSLSLGRSAKDAKSLVIELVGSIESGPSYLLSACRMSLATDRPPCIRAGISDHSFRSYAAPLKSAQQESARSTYPVHFWLVSGTVLLQLPLKVGV